MTRFPERQIAAWTVAILFCLFPFPNIVLRVPIRLVP